MRRQKCDNSRPCASCRRIGATCTSEPASSATSTAGFDPASLAILGKLTELQAELKTVSERVSHGGGPVLAVHSLDGHDASPLARASVHDQPQPCHHLDRHLQRGNFHQVLEWDIWQPHQTPPAYHAGHDEPGAESPSFTRVQAAASNLNLDLSLFTSYLDAFFRNVHVLNPVLDEQLVRAQLTNLLLNGVSWDAASCLLLLVVANGASSVVFGDMSTTEGPEGGRDEQRWATAQALFDAAEKRKDMLWRSDYLTQARCYFYSGMFMMVSMRPFDAWRQFLQGLATCQRFTSHRQRLRDPASQSQAEQSIYWSCWKSERELRFELDVPDFGSAGFGHPITFPTLPAQVSDQEQLRAWYFYLAEISLWRFEMAARQTMSESATQHPTSLDTLAERIVDLDESLSSWRASLPEAIRLDARVESPSSPNAATAADVLLFVLRGRLTYNYEVLTWPFLETYLLLGSAHRSARATELAARGVQIHFDRLEINRPGFYHRHHGTWLMQRSSTRSATVLLAVARSSSASSMLPACWQTLVAETIDMLEYWTESPEDETVVFLKSVLHDVMQ